MKYSSQLKGWAIDRVIELAKLNICKINDPISIDAVMEDAKKLADMCYVQSEDVNDMEQRVQSLKEEIEYIQAVMMKPASNALDSQEGNA